MGCVGSREKGNEIWDALRAAAEADFTLTQAIVDSAGVIVQNPDLKYATTREVPSMSYPSMFSVSLQI